MYLLRRHHAFFRLLACDDLSTACTTEVILATTKFVVGYEGNEVDDEEKKTDSKACNMFDVPITV